jgi:hypothetical protein
VDGGTRLFPIDSDIFIHGEKMSYQQRLPKFVHGYQQYVYKKEQIEEFIQEWWNNLPGKVDKGKETELECWDFLGFENLMEYRLYTDEGADVEQTLEYRKNHTEEPLCEATFEKWSKENPQKLINFIDTYRDRNGRLTFAAEWAGFCRDALDSLVKLTDHESAVVREGALMGLENYYQKFIQKDLYKILKASNKHRQEGIDSSPGVRSRANYFYGHIAEDAEHILNCKFLEGYSYLDDEDEDENDD